jgi:MoxR-like ATPase
VNHHQSDQFSGTDQYIVASDLRHAVNVAIALQRPLLIRGEPGTGKTLLARAVAESFGHALFTWHVKSTSKAQDGLYVYDTVQRLNDSRFGDGDVSDIRRYIKLGPLGRAFSKAERSVVLIDEIDKADPEFPNDLLHELDTMSFHIYETGETIKANVRPIVIISSNADKELPDAFLRRCVFHYIAFPDKEQMENIIKVHHPDIESKLLSQCLVKFYWLRDLPEIRKRPSTSELVDWIAALKHAGLSPSAIERELPFLGVLLKRESDVASVLQRFHQKRW